ncbi:hypothetical protein GE061_020343 [Apolygus lucorum]|uniref:Uncharacterized protein n=1 Tax=Apolygus lucorum TaxID=248454 RepID=A0A8S9WN80_APOLU|nr:hypothetical protein GE061_020343 [Apolygus lucorum]
MSESPIVISSDNTPVGSPVHEVVIDLSAKEEFPPSRPSSPVAGCSHWPTRADEEAKEDVTTGFSEPRRRPVKRALTYDEEELDASAATEYDESEVDPTDLTNAPKRPKNKDGNRLRNLLIKLTEQLLLTMVLHFQDEMETWKINPTELREIPTVIKFALITHPRCLQNWFARLVQHFAKDVAKLPGTTSGLKFTEWFSLRANDLFMTSTQELKHWALFMKSFWEQSPITSGCSCPFTLTREGDIFMRSTCATGRDNKEVVDVQDSGISLEQRGKDDSSSTTPLSRRTPSGEYCSIFVRHPDGSYSKKHLVPSGEMFMSIQMGDWRKISELPTREWWKAMDLNLRTLIDPSLPSTLTNLVKQIERAAKFLSHVDQVVPLPSSINPQDKTNQDEK